MSSIKKNGFLRTDGPRRATRKDLIKQFQDLMNDNRGGIVDFPLRYIEDYKLHDALEPLRVQCHGILSDDELLKGAKLAKISHLIDSGRQISEPLTTAEKKSLEIQRSSAFWKEPKDLLLTLCACSLASLTQGWDQAATGNLGWPGEFGLDIDVHHPTGRDVWIFGGVQSIMWFSAAILGSYLSDPISEHIGRRGALFVAALCSFTSVIGASRTHSWQQLFVTRILLGLGIGGKASVVPILESEVVPAAKRGRLLVGWQIFVATGLFAGFTSSYIFRDHWRHQILTGAIPAFALLLFTWVSCESPRWLIIQGKHDKAFETLVRLRKERIIAAKELCSIYYQIQAERWLFSGERKWDEEDDGMNPFDPEMKRTSYWRRLSNHFTFPRMYRAAIAAMVVMLSQQLSGINIIAFLATTFFTTAGLRPTSNGDAEVDSYKLAMGFGAANAIFSTWAYFLVENNEEPSPQSEMSSPSEIRLDQNDEASSQHTASATSLSAIEENPPQLPDDDAILPDPISKRISTADGVPSTIKATTKEVKRSSNGLSDGIFNGAALSPKQTSVVPSVASSIYSNEAPPSTSSDDDVLYETRESHQWRGRRFLLLLSLAGGVFTLLITSLCFNIPEGNPARLPVIAVFIIIFTLFYSLGAGAVAFLYCAEVFPNEGREIGMSWSTFWNFSGAGLLALFVPFGINWGHGRLLGLFSGFNAIAFILVYFLVPSTNQTATLEDMSYIFGRRTRDHAKAQLKRLYTLNRVKGPRTIWRTAHGQGGSVRSVEGYLRDGRGVGGESGRVDGIGVEAEMEKSTGFGQVTGGNDGSDADVIADLKEK